MEITVQDANSLRIKGKNATIFINPKDKNATYNAAILLGNPDKATLKLMEGVVVIDGPGEYEAGGVKISGQRADKNTVYIITIDNLSVLVGDRDSLNTMHQKLQGNDVAVVYAGVEGDISFATSLASYAVLFFGEKGQEAVDKFAKDEKKVMSKYQISAEKPPLETETVLLS